MSVKNVDYNGINEGGIDAQHNHFCIIKDASGNDVTSAAIASGSITTKNLVPAGTATAGSAVELTIPATVDSATIQISGTYTGDLSLQGTVDGSIWVTFGGNPFSNINSGNTGAVIPSGVTSIFQTDVAGMAKIRVTGLGTMTGTATITIRGTTATSGIALDTSLPLGDNAIGKVTINKFRSPDRNQLSIEGSYIDSNIASLTKTWSRDGVAYANSAINICAVGLGRAAFVESIKIDFCGGVPTWLTGYLIGGGYSSSFAPILAESYNEMVPADGGPIVLPVNKFCLEGTTFSYVFTPVGSGPKQPYTINAKGFTFTDDWNFGAKSTVLVCGDSLSFGNMGNDALAAPYKNKWIYPAQLVRQLGLNGKSVRQVNKSFGGSYGDIWSQAIYDNYISGIDYDLMIVMLGTNDSINTSGWTTTQFEGYLKEFIYHRNMYRPNASIIFCTPIPTDTATRTAGIASFRTSVATVANDATIGTSANKVYLYDAYATFVAANPGSTVPGLNNTAASDTYFASGERSAGNRLHMSGIGQQLFVFGTTLTPTVGAGLYGVVLTTDWYKNYA